MDWLSVVLAVVAFATGLRAAQLWWKASRVPIKRKWEARDPFEDIDAAALAHVLGLIDAVNESSELNATAAKWTAIAVAAGSLGTLISLLKDVPLWKS